MEIVARVKIVKRLFENGLIVKPASDESLFTSALLLLKSQNEDVCFLMKKNLTAAAEIEGVFDLVPNGEKFNIYLKELLGFAISQTVNNLTKGENKEKKPNRLLSVVGAYKVSDRSEFKKKPIEVVRIGKPFQLQSKLKDIPDWLYEKLNGSTVNWNYFEFIDAINQPLNESEIQVDVELESNISLFKSFGEKTRNKSLIHSEAPGNINLQKLCDLRNLTGARKIFFVVTNNYIWLLEHNPSDPIPNVKLKNISYNGWILSKVGNLEVINKLKQLDALIKKNPSSIHIQ
ncbi:TPA: hypothetical protein MW242_003302 [Acinetobacter baumannii]|nr:hypothetical protein [Acinetobacter baumannii]